MIVLEEDSPTRRQNAKKAQLLESENESNTYHKLKVFQRFGLQRFFSELIFPGLLMSTFPIAIMALWYICQNHEGSITDFLNNISYKIFFDDMLFGQWKGSFFSIYVTAGYMVWATLLTIYLPGKTYNGPITDKGNTPVYQDNGMLFYIINLVVFFSITIFLECFTDYSVTIICDRYGEFLVLMNVGGSVFCLFLYIKGMFFPSSSDNGSSGNPVFDYYWGVELYPRIGGVDVKLMTNCRWGMMVWSLVVILFWLKSLKTYGFVDGHCITMTLIVCYLGKFFYWESGYMKTMDICVDRAGWYLCYGCICYVPIFYTLPSIYLAYHPVHLGMPLASLILCLGFICLYLNYDADNQRVIVRATNGNCLVWNKEPTIIRAKYVLLNGNQSENILLASGYWGISSHFHYIPELGLAFCWCTTAMFQNLLPYLYFIFLLILLTHRSIRDDNKCSNKYGKYWLEYRKLVPHKIVPYVF